METRLRGDAYELLSSLRAVLGGSFLHDILKVMHSASAALLKWSVEDVCSWLVEIGMSGKHSL